MTTKTKTVKQTLATVRKCFICSAPIERAKSKDSVQRKSANGNIKPASAILDSADEGLCGSFPAGEISQGSGESTYLTVPEKKFKKAIDEVDRLL